MATHLACSLGIVLAIALLGSTTSWARPTQCASDKDCATLGDATCEAGICVESPCNRTTCKPGTFCVAKSRRASCVDPCASNPCLNGATCWGKDAKTPVCKCTAGYRGKYCEAPTDPCVATQCGPGSFCVADDGSASCVDPCETDPCMNGATCNGQDSQTRACACAMGWMGDSCEQDINECQVSPCVNGGTCTDLVAGYSCACPAGWTGTHCDVAVP